MSNKKELSIAELKDLIRKTKQRAADIRERNLLLAELESAEKELEKALENKPEVSTGPIKIIYIERDRSRDLDWYWNHPFWTYPNVVYCSKTITSDTVTPTVTCGTSGKGISTYSISTTTNGGQWNITNDSSVQ